MFADQHAQEDFHWRGMPPMHHCETIALPHIGSHEARYNSSSSRSRSSCLSTGSVWAATSGTRANTSVFGMFINQHGGILFHLSLNSSCIVPHFPAFLHTVIASVSSLVLSSPSTGLISQGLLVLRYADPDGATRSGSCMGTGDGVTAPARFSCSMSNGVGNCCRVLFACRICAFLEQTERVGGAFL
jgi:hypothetical protein